jgi:hypothetical protein
MKTDSATMENRLQLLKRVNIEMCLIMIYIRSSNSTPKYILKRNESKDPNRYLYMTFIAAVFTTAKGCKQSKCLWTGKQVNKM